MFEQVHSKQRSESSTYEIYSESDQEWAETDWNRRLWVNAYNSKSRAVESHKYK